MKHRTNIKDVASKLNYSISTISRAFNDKYDINPETKKIILECAKEMGYTPNPIARNLPQNKSFLVGVVVPEFINDFFPKVIMGIQSIMSKEGYQVLIMSSHESAKDELEIVKTLETNMVDGIIISLTHETCNVSYYQEMLERDFPIVQFNRVNYKLSTSKVVFEDYLWAMYATEHLIEEGCRKIYHFSGPNNLIISQQRKKGYTDALKKHSLPCEDNMIFETGLFIEDGEKMARILIEKKDIPDAIFCFNDPTAIGAIKEFKNSGMKIPEDVAFVGFSESNMDTHLTPTLTSVSQPTHEIGETAARLLLEQIKAKNTKLNQIITLGGQLNIRESSLRR